MPDESVYDESAFRQYEADAAVAGDNTDAALIAEKRAAALGINTTEPPAGRHARSAEEIAAETAPAEVASADEA